MTTLHRPSRREVDDAIVERAAALFAQHGFEQTSLQAIATATGYSKAGLLHYYASKEALHEAALTLCRTRIAEAVQPVELLPLGLERDLRAVHALVDFALASPGLVALAISRTGALLSKRVPQPPDPQDRLLPAFGVDPETEPERVVRVIAAFAAISLLALAAHHVGDQQGWRAHIVAASFDALGHHTPARLQHPDGQEA